jgi:hypothetical protein
VARSGRMLAQSACRGGWRPWVIDAFADVDARACAQGFVQVTMDGAGSMNALDLLTGLSLLPAPGADLVYGAGMESMPGLLRRLSANYRVVGNTPEVLGAVRDPRRFFAVLDDLGIPHPGIRFAPPAGDLKDATEEKPKKCLFGSSSAPTASEAGTYGRGTARRWAGAGFTFSAICRGRWYLPYLRPMGLAHTSSATTHNGPPVWCHSPSPTAAPSIEPP